MDPISMALVGALASGVAKGVGEAAKSLIPDAYDALKTAIQKKVGADSDVAEALESVEKKPESKSRQGVLAEEIAAAGLDKDADLLKLAQALAEALKDAGGDTFNATAGENSTIVQGSGNVVAGSGGIAIGGNVKGDVRMGGNKEDDR